MPFPWQRSAPAATRLAEATGALNALPSTDFYPFDAATALSNSLISACAGWPDASAASAQPGRAAERADADPLRRAGPAHADLERAAVAAKIPDAQLLVVPYTGHSVIGSDFSNCASLAVTAFFAVGRAGSSAAVRAERQPVRADAADADEARLRAPGSGVERQAEPDADRRARHDRRPQPPGGRRHAAGRRAAAQRLELRRAARRLREAEHRQAAADSLHVHPRRRTERHVPGQQRPAADDDPADHGVERRARHRARGLGQAGHGRPRRQALRREHRQGQALARRDRRAGASEAEWSSMPFAFPLPQLSRLR